jgi:hypothetical protein
MWLVRVALERPDTFVVLALLVLLMMDASVLLVNALRGAWRVSSLPTLHELIQRETSVRYEINARSVLAPRHSVRSDRGRDHRLNDRRLICFLKHKRRTPTRVLGLTRARRSIIQLE